MALKRPWSNVIQYSFDPSIQFLVVLTPDYDLC